MANDKKDELRRLVYERLPRSGGEADLTRQLSERIESGFEQSAARTPTATALVTLAETLTYAELNARAEALAGVLQSQYTIGGPVQPNEARLALPSEGAEVCVGLCCEKSAAMLVGMLGILKAGAAYVPLDPEYPALRAAAILEDCSALVVVAQAGVCAWVQSGLVGAVPVLPVHESGRLAEGGGAVLLAPATAAAAVRRHPPAAVASGARRACYVLYTSGSTGKPKGVVLEHRNVQHFVHAITRHYPLRADCRSLFIVSATFDVHVHNVYPAFMRGGAVYAFPKWHLLDNIEHILSTHKITTLQCTPSALSLIPVESATHLESALISGEVLPPELMRGWAARVPFFFNKYGPTECAVDVTATRCKPGMRFPFSIGTPLCNMRIYIVDPADVARLQPPSVPGELVVSGPQVGRGYVNLPDLTARNFVESPFDAPESEHGRLYRTGDLCRWLEDGTVGYMGRIDRQVKLRGFRIEVGEVESVLLGHASVVLAAVVLRQGGSRTPHLAAYVQLSAPCEDRGAEQALCEELMDRSKATLPTYSVPSKIRVLMRLPQTDSGKIDRQKLLLEPSQFDGGASQQTAQHVPPSSPAEAAVVAAFAAALGLEADAISATAGFFFELGGDSLAVTSVLASLRGRWPAARAAAVVLHPTAQRLAAAMAGDQTPQLPILRPRESKEPCPLSWNQTSWLNGGGRGNQLAKGLWIDGALDVAALRDAISHTASRHSILRTRYFKCSAGEQVQMVVDESLAAQGGWFVRTSAIDDVEAMELAMQDASTPMAPLAGGSMFQVLCIKCERPDKRLLVVRTHHIAFDGWSWGIFLRDLARAYDLAAAGGGRPVAAAAEHSTGTLQYTDFVMWQRNLLSSPVLEQQKRYWRKQLAGVKPLSVPFAGSAWSPGEGQWTCEGGKTPFRVPPTVAAKLRDVGREQGATLFSVMLALWAAVLCRCSGEREVLISSQHHGRDAVGSAGIVGCFVNRLAYRIKIRSGSEGHLDHGGGSCGRSLVSAVARVAVEAMANSLVPLQSIVDEMVPRGAASASDALCRRLCGIRFAWEQLGGWGARARARAAGTSCNGGSLPTLGVATLQAVPLHGPHLRLAFDLRLVSRPTADGGISGALWYNAEAFAHDAAGGMMRCLELAAEAMVTSPDVADFVAKARVLPE